MSAWKLSSWQSYSLNRPHLPCHTRRDIRDGSGLQTRLDTSMHQKCAEISHSPTQRPKTAPCRHIRGYVVQNWLSKQVAPQHNTAALCNTRGLTDLRSATAPAMIRPNVLVIPANKMPLLDSLILFYLNNAFHFSNFANFSDKRNETKHGRHSFSQEKKNNRTLYSRLI